MGLLETAGTVLGLANSAKSLLGGSSGDSEAKSLKRQYEYQIRSAWELPQYQVMGLRNAGLNPMLAVSNGLSPPPSLQASPGKDEELDIRRAEQQTNSAVAASRAAAETDLLRAQTEKTKAETENIPLTGVNIRADTFVKDQTGILAKLNHAKTTEETRQLAATATQEEIKAAVSKINAFPQAAEALKQAMSETQIKSSSAKAAAMDEQILNSFGGEIGRLLRFVIAAIRGR